MDLEGLFWVRRRARESRAAARNSLAGDCCPGNDAHKEPASWCARPRCALKSTHTPMTTPSRRQIRDSYHQGFGEPKITGTGWVYEYDHVWNQQDKAIPADAMRRFWAGPRGDARKPRCALKSIDAKTSVPSPRSSQCGSSIAAASKKRWCGVLSTQPY
jgi:hypothetical protein